MKYFIISLSIMISIPGFTQTKKSIENIEDGVYPHTEDTRAERQEAIEVRKEWDQEEKEARRREEIKREQDLKRAEQD